MAATTQVLEAGGKAGDYIGACGPFHELRVGSVLHLPGALCDLHRGSKLVKEAQMWLAAKKSGIWMVFSWHLDYYAVQCGAGT